MARTACARLVGVFALGLLSVSTGVLGGCSTNAATGKSQFVGIMPPRAEIAMGEGAKPELTAEYGGEVGDASVRAYVTEVGSSMTPYTEGDNPGLPWEFTLLDSDVINAFALPGGKVFISRGLAEKLSNEAELASVLGHEIGHVTAKHVVDRVNRQYGLAIGAALIGAAAQSSDEQFAQIGGQALITGAGVYALSFDRDQESEADALGIRYMVRAGYNPIGSLRSMEVLAAEAAGGGRQPEFLSTHPYPETRVERIRSVLQSEYPGALANESRDTFANRYHARMLSKLAAGGAAGRATIAAESAPRGRLGVLTVPGAAHGGSQVPSAHNPVWCLLCTKQQDAEVREAITAGSE